MKALALLLACGMSFRAGEKDPPNIVLILADDFGHGHVSCLNPKSKIQTPHIDALAKEGITFTDAHSGSAVCSPTRYGLLTGRYAWRTRMVRGVLGPFAAPLIEKDRLTLPAMLRQKGYHTACIGKWHLGWGWGNSGHDFTKPIPEGPTARGFDFYFGTDVPNYPPYCFIENDRTVGLPTENKPAKDDHGRPGPMLPGWKFEAILPTLAERAVSYIGDSAREKRKFFLYFSLTSPHEPVTPSEAFRGKSGLNSLADFILETDAVVGKVLEALKTHGLEKNTLVIFTGDNGSSMYTGGGQLKALGHEPSAGFRGAKGDSYEGGHRVPFFARWPGKITPGEKTQETLCLTDLMATCAALVDAKLPADAAEDSVSMLPALLGAKRKAPLREATVHQSSSGQLAIRQGPWKLIEALEGSKAAPRELFNLAEDPGETKDVLKSNPEAAERLAALLEKYRREGRSRP